jgi:hypothetical protein
MLTIFVVWKTVVTTSMQSAMGQSQFSKQYLMYLATNVASAAVDFAKENVEDGVVDNPLSLGGGRLPIYLPSPLRGCQSTPI